MYHTVFDGAETNITFANGTEIEFMNSATTLEDLSDITDGKSFFEKFCTGKIFGSGAVTPSKSLPKPTQGKLGYQPRIPASYHEGRLSKRDMFYDHGHDVPKAVVEAKSGAVAGYFLKGVSYEDLAVLKIITFQPDDEIEFQQTIADFLEECRKERKTQLVIDLRENGGGSVQLLIDTFMQLFPHRKVWQGARYRAHDQFNIIGDAVSEIWNNETLHDYYKSTWNSTIKDDFRYWAYGHFLNAHNENFESWDEMKGPEKFNDDYFTAQVRYNVSVSSSTRLSADVLI